MFQKIIVGDDDAEGGRDAGVLALRLTGPDSRLVTGHIPDGDDVADGLYRLVSEEGADLLVVGAHHHHGLVGADHARAALQHAPCAVAIAPAGFSDAADTAIRVIGVGYQENDPASDLALSTAQAVAETTDAQVRVTHAVPETNWEAPGSGAGRLAVASRQRLSDLPGVTVFEGSVHDALVALEQDVDLLVLGSHQHGALRRVAVGDTVAGLARDLVCPLLVVPAGD